MTSPTESVKVVSHIALRQIPTAPKKSYTSESKITPAQSMSLCINPDCSQPQNTDTQIFCSTCGSEILLEGRYRVTRPLGAGGFGKTYEVLDRNIPKVLKVLINNDAKYVELFQREAEVLSRLNHPGIPKVDPDGYFTVFPRQSNEPLHCIVMEKVEGMNLEEYLQGRQNRPINQRIALDWLKEIIVILDSVHSENFFHRDIKPSNIMIKPDGVLVLIDFGTAREVTGAYLAKMAENERLTLVQSLGYSPIEQLHGYPVFQSDFFALGCTFIYLLTGQHPFSLYDLDGDGYVWRDRASHISPLILDHIDHLTTRRYKDRPPNTQAILAKLQEIELTLYPPKIPFTPPTPTPTNQPSAKNQPTPNSHQPTIRCQTFSFDIATLEKRHTGLFGNKTTWEITRRRSQAEYFIEDLGSGVILEMVSIPGGTFLMGSPNTEEERSDSEGPQHYVTVPPFYMGKFTVTQAQWKAVAALPQVNLTLNPDPSRFKGNNLPVESVNWFDAVEFCARLAKKTGRDYRLPSEAEWEYACRAGTNTPFHFGETITPDLVNYNGNYPYGSAPKGEYRGKTTPVGSFQAANAFGLFDMHGNVGEWCMDSWHENYSGSPIDGSRWRENDNQKYRLLRGGSWSYTGRYCRGAYRFRIRPDSRDYYSGFRLVVS